MLADPHFKVAWYEQDSSKVFSNTDIKGGVVVSYHSANDDFGSIGTFTPYPELNSIMHKASPRSETNSVMPIVYNQNRFDLDALYLEHPEYRKVIGSDGRDKRFRNNIFEKIDAFTEEKTSNSDIPVIGVIKNKRNWRYLPKRYIETTHENFLYYKVLISSASGTGALGESLGTPYIASPNEAYTQTFIGIGAVSSLFEAEAIEKYLRSKFCRMLIGVLKITQHITPSSFRYVPIQDFTNDSDIDWKQSVPEIDRQLYKKYGLNDAEIQFIELMAKEMA